MSRCAIAIVAGVLAIVASGCEREARRFEQPPNTAALPDSIRLSEIQPGAPSAVPVQNGYEENAYALAEGQRLYRWYNCNGCHANGGGGQGPPLMDDTWIYGSEPANIFATIVQGRPNGMPSFAGRIPEAELWKLVAYVRSMSGLVPGDAAPGRRETLQAKKPESRREAEQPKSVALPAGAQ